MNLPVSEILADLVEALHDRGVAVLHAPPGSGKSTLVPGALLDGGCAGEGEIWMLQPRRAACRAVARRVAELRGEPLGQTVGYQVRFDSKVSKATRIRFVTEGILTRRLQSDPSLEGIGAVVFDEFHERSLNADLGLALTQEVREALRPDLVLVVMSATLDAEPIAAFLGDAPILRATGRQYPIQISHEAAPERRGWVPAVAAAAEALRKEMEGGVCPEGHLLVFVPGVRMIEDTLATLRRQGGWKGWEFLPLHGRLSAQAQDEAIRPASGRRVIVSTNIAETSLTIEGVTAVLDTGLAKILRYDPSLGMNRLETVKTSRASAEQRAGRAGRMGPGRAVRLWTEADHALRPAFDTSEIQRVELARLLLDTRAWGIRDLASAALFEAPPAPALARARALLRDLGALDAEGAITPMGTRLSTLPTDPRIGRLLLAAQDLEIASAGCWAAAWLQEAGRLPRGPSSRQGACDVVEALRRDPPHGKGLVVRAARQFARALGGDLGPMEGLQSPAVEEALCQALFRAWPDRVGRRQTEDRVVLADGRGARLAEESAVQADALLVALDLDAGRRGEQSRSLIRVASRVDPAWLEASADFASGDEVRWDSGDSRVVAHRVERYRDLVLSSRPIPLADREAAAACLLEAATADPAGALGLRDGDDQVLHRLALVARTVPDSPVPGDPQAWLEDQLPRLCAGRSSFKQLRALPPGGRLLDGLGWKERKALDELAPERLEVPSGSQIRLTYGADGPPILAVRVQEVFGWSATPTIARGRQTVVLHLLNPAQRPLQVTEDLQSFWTRTWPEVRGEMRSRYPKHRWPEDPAAAEPTRHSTTRRRR